MLEFNVQSFSQTIPLKASSGKEELLDLALLNVQ